MTSARHVLVRTRREPADRVSLGRVKSREARNERTFKRATGSRHHAARCLDSGSARIVTSEPEPVQHVWRNHDHDLVDVRLTTTDATTHAKTGGATNADAAGSTGSTAQSTACKTASQAMTLLHRWVRQGAVAAGLAATPPAPTTGRP